MAIFQGEDLVDVTTPDGRTLKLPRSIVPASMLPQQISTLPGAIESAPATTRAMTPGLTADAISGVGELPGPDSVTGGEILDEGATVPDMVPATPPRPDYQLGTIDTEALARARGAQMKNEAKQNAARAAQGATPQGRQETARQAERSAAESEKQARDYAGGVEAAGLDMLADAQAQHNVDINRLLDKRDADAWAAFQQEESKRGEIEHARKAISNTKIDRKADHPILAAISIALADLGSAMKGQELGRSLDIFWKSLDRKVAAQMADLDLMEKTYGMQKDELAALKDKSGRKLELYNIMIGGEAEKAKRHLEEIGAKSASEKVRAGVKVMLAQIDQRIAESDTKALQWGLDYDFKEKAERNQQGRFYAGLRQADRHHADDVQLKREDMYLDWQKYLGNVKAQGNEAEYKAKLEMLKDNETRGIKSVVDKMPLMTKAGRAKMDQAAQLEAEAAQLEESSKADPLTFSVKGGKDRVQLMREKAAQLRGEATLVDVVRARDPNQAGQISKKWAAAQGMMQVVDEINDLYDQAGRGYIGRDKLQQELQAKMGLLSVKAKDAWQLGAWDKGSANLVAGIIGGDPTQGWDTGNIAYNFGLQIGKDPEGFKNRLKAVTQSLEQDIENELSTNTSWDDKGELFARKTKVDPSTPAGKASADISKGKTPVETAEGFREAGPASVVVDRFRFQSREDKARAAEEGGSLKYPGLQSGEQEQGFDKLLTSYKTGNVKDGDALVAKVTSEAVARPELAAALAHNLREHAPDLYVKMRAAVPKGSPLEGQLSYEEKTRIGAAQQPTPMLAQQVISTLDQAGKVTDQEGWKELSRRAATGDPEAKRAIPEIVKQSGIRKLPAGSVFREGR